MLPSLILVSSVAAGLSAVAFGALQMHRRDVRTPPSAFRCALRVVSGDVDGLGREFRRTAAYAQWVRDVLVVWSGRTLSRVRTLEVATAGYRLYDVDADEAPGLGLYPLVLTVCLDGGQAIEIAAARRNRERLMQPFVGPRAVHRRRDARMLEETARLVRRAHRHSRERKEQEVPR